MRLKIRHLGPITNAELTFGDLTVFVGPQATGKSIALQMLKLTVDTGYVQDIMTRHGLDWSGKLPEFFDAYFGEGIRKSWLRDSAPRLNAMRKRFVWVSSGKTSFTLSSPQQKQFALLGLQQKGRLFRIPNEAAI
jgi:hypothetical protein